MSRRAWSYPLIVCTGVGLLVWAGLIWVVVQLI